MCEQRDPSPRFCRRTLPSMRTVPPRTVRWVTIAIAVHLSSQIQATTQDPHTDVSNCEQAAPPPPSPEKKKGKGGKKYAVPVVDFNKWFNGNAEDKVAAATALGDAFASHGFVIAVNTSIRSSAVARLRAASYDFFDQALAAKERWNHHRGYGYGGYLPPGNENGAHLLGDFEKPQDLVESFTIRGLKHLPQPLPRQQQEQQSSDEKAETTAGDGEEADRNGARGGRGGSRTKDRDAPAPAPASAPAPAPASAPALPYTPVLGQDMSDPGALDPIPPLLLPSIKEFHAGLRSLRAAIATMAAVSLGLEQRYFDSFSEVDDCGLRLAHYPEQTATPRGGQMRYGPHVDSGAITMVAVDPASPLGLEVFLPEDEVWVDVCDAQDGLPPVEELLVLNCGATMARMTHGKWRSALHRVQNHPPRRLSIITSALSAKREAMLEVLPSCYTGDTPPHPPIKAKEFMDERAKLQRTDTKERASAELTQDVLEYRV